MSMLDTTSPLPAFSSEASEAIGNLNARGFQVLGVAKAGGAPTAAGGFDFAEETRATRAVSGHEAAAAKKRYVPACRLCLSAITEPWVGIGIEQSLKTCCRSKACYEMSADTDRH